MEAVVIVAVSALLLVVLLAAVVVIYCSRTTWEAQRRQAENTKLVVTALLSRAPETTSLAHTLAAQPSAPPLDSVGQPMGYTRPDENHRLVRVPLGPVEREDLYDDAEQLQG